MFALFYRLIHLRRDKMGKADRGKVWLGVSGLLINEKNEWLVVNKKYGGLKGKWSLPAGFVEQDETADEAIIREVKEETGLSCRVKEMIGLRTGVIKGEISDNMVIFLLEADTNQTIVIEDKELDDVNLWITGTYSSSTNFSHDSVYMGEPQS